MNPGKPSDLALDDFFAMASKHSTSHRSIRRSAYSALKIQELGEKGEQEFYL